MITKKTKSIDHLFENDDMTFNELFNLLKQALLGKLDTLVDGKIVEKTDGQNLLATYKDGKTIIAFGSGKELDIDKLEERYPNKPALAESYRKMYEVLDNAFQSVKNIDLYLSNGDVWINMEILNPETQNVIWYGTKIVVQFHSFLEIKDKQRNEWTENIKNLINEFTDDDYIISDNEVFLKSRDLEDNAKVIGSLQHKFKTLLTNEKLDDSATIREYYKASFKNIIKVKWPMMDKDSVEFLVNRWGGYNRSYKLNNLPDKTLYQAVREFDDEAWKISQELKNKIKVIVYFAGTYICKGITNYICTDISRSKKETVDEYNSFKNSITSLDKNEQDICNKIIEIINNIGMDNYVPIEGIVFNYKGKQYKITNGLFTLLNQLFGLVKYKDKNKKVN